MQDKSNVSSPSTLILVRHGHVAGITPERFRGRTELPLTELGLKQAGVTAKYLPLKWKADAIYSSPLGRCTATAGLIASECGLKVQPLTAMIDIDYGIWQGETVDDVKAKHPALYEQWRTRPHLTVIENAESLADVQARLVRALAEIFERETNRTVIIVGHDSTIRVLLILLLNMPLSAYWKLKQDPCAVNVLAFADDECQLQCINSTAHLTQVE